MSQSEEYFFPSITIESQNVFQYLLLKMHPPKVSDEFSTDSRTSESNARHFHLINSNQVQDQSSVYILGMPNVESTSSGYLTFRMKTKITLRKYQLLTFKNTEPKDALLKDVFEWIVWKSTEFQRTFSQEVEKKARILTINTLQL